LRIARSTYDSGVGWRHWSCVSLKQKAAKRRSPNLRASLCGFLSSFHCVLTKTFSRCR